MTKGMERLSKLLEYLDKNKIKHKWIENKFPYVSRNIASFVIIPIYKGK